MTNRSIHDLAAAMRGHRTDLGMSQAELAERTGVSRKWIYEFEAGSRRRSLGCCCACWMVLAFASSWLATLGIDSQLALDRVLVLARRAPDAFSESTGTPDVVTLGSSLPARVVDRLQSASGQPLL